MAKKEEVKKNLSLDERIAVKKVELIEAKKGLSGGTLQNPHVIGKIKKEIARLLTKKNSEGKGE